MNMRRVFVGVALCGVLLAPACATPVSVQTPAAQAAFKADQAVQAVGAFQDAVIAANTQGLIADAKAVALVKVTRGIIVTLGAVPSGWQATVTTGWVEAKKQLSPSDIERFKGLILAVDTSLSVIGGV